MNLDNIAEAFAASAVDSSRWTAAMEAAAVSTGAFGAVLVPITGRMASIPHSPSMAQSLERYIEDDWVHHDERYHGTRTIARKGVATEFDFTTVDEIAKLPYYQEFLAPCRLRWWAGVKVACGDDFWCLSIQRTIDQGPFSEAEQQRLAKLSTQLASAAALARALSFARADAAMAAFEASGTAIALLDIRREVLKANESAECLLGTDLQIVRNRLVSFDRAATAALDQALHQLLWTRSASALMPPVVLPRRNGRPVLAYPMRLASVTGTPLGDCQAIVVLVDLDRQERPPEAVLRATFGLTAAEAKLAQSLISGKTLQNAADFGGISQATAHSQLKAIFAKTQTHKQSEMVSLLARLRQPLIR
jgi:DNA-binding CsgD family transcriptional regulator